MKRVAVVLVMLISHVISAQQSTTINERRVVLSETAVAFGTSGASALEARLLSSPINGASATPVTNIRMVVRNSSSISYSFVSGVVTFYDVAGVRCGEGVFKADVLAVNESFETDSPGVRIRCTPSSWRVVATSLVPRVVIASSPN